MHGNHCFMCFLGFFFNFNFYTILFLDLGSPAGLPGAIHCPEPGCEKAAAHKALPSVNGDEDVVQDNEVCPKASFSLGIARLGAGSFPPSSAAVIIWAQLIPPGPIYTFKGVYKPSPPCNRSTRRFTCRRLSPNVLQGGKGYPGGDNHILGAGFLILRYFLIQIVWT